ncbi:alkaline phosphatase family protein [Rhodopila sp.]|uniref:alkaline phosphatase family protein n=1 Tax=Rhodopila sp. TaxID=2480087 RepID=UPI003D0CF5E0
MRRLIAFLFVAPCLLAPASATEPHNVLLFVADGLRAGMVTEQNAPTMATLLKQGVRFANSHSVFPTSTMPNAAAMATGHMPGDTGAFGNTIHAGFPVPNAGDSPTPLLASGPVLGDLDAHFAGNHLNEATILRAAAEAGISTASIGKPGPSLMFDHTERSGKQTVIADDMTGRTGGIPMSAEMLVALKQAGLAAQAPARGDNAKAGDFRTPGTLVANVGQQAWFADIATKAVLPVFKDRHKPFVMVFWSRDPGGTQHNQGDSLLRLIPGINGPTSLAAIGNADDDLARLLTALKALGLDATTDVILASDHGGSTISKESATSFAATQTYKDVPPALLPPGFVAIDLAQGLAMKLFDPDAKREAKAVPLAPASHSVRANGLIGDDPAHPQVVVAANGGSDLIYLPVPDPALAARIVHILAAQDYTSGLFVDQRFGAIPGTLPLAAVALEGTALTPMPAIAVNFRTFSLGCADPTTCGVEVADTVLQQGQGIHGSFSRADTRNVMGAIGPGFRMAYADPMPASNADIGRTIAALLGLTIKAKGALLGRALTEAMPNGAMVGFRPLTLRSPPDAAGRMTVVKYQAVGATRYFDAAGYPGRTLGLQ